MLFSFFYAILYKSKYAFSEVCPLMPDKRPFYEGARDPAFRETVRTSQDCARIREYLLSERTE